MKSPGQILSSFLKMVVVMLLPVLIPIWLIDRWITEGEAIDAVKLENRIECDLQTLSFQVLRGKFSLNRLKSCTDR